MTFGNMLNIFSFWLSSNLSKQKSPTTEIIAILSCRNNVPIKYMPLIFAIGLFCLDKFDDNQTRKCSTFFPNVSYLTELYFGII